MPVTGVHALPATERLVIWHRWVPSARGEAEDIPQVARWMRTVVARMRAGGGELLALVGGVAVCALDGAEIDDAIDTALALAEEADAIGVPVVFGVALGELTLLRDAQHGTLHAVGQVIDRAELLANRARRGDIVLDATARARAEASFLFARSVGAGGGALRGQALDRAHPRLSTCRDALALLRPPVLPPAHRAKIAEVAKLLSRSGSPRILLRGPVGAGSSAWIDAIGEAVGAPSLRLGPMAGAFEPLGSLRAALVTRFGSIEAVEAELDPPYGAVLGRIARGRAVTRAQAVSAIGALLASAEAPRLVVLDPLLGIDPASVEVIGEATHGGTECATLARLPVDTRLPAPLVRAGDVHDVLIPALSPAEARAVAQSVLGAADDECVKRVAELGGTTPLGVLEAARTLVATGAIIHDAGAFRMRTATRAPEGSATLDTLLRERAAPLPSGTYRVLEAACVAPDASPESLVATIAIQDGVAAEGIRDELEVLRAQRFLNGVSPSSRTLRSMVLEQMPPARAAELHRFAADALGVDLGEHALATRAHFLAEGGLPEEAARLFLHSAGHAASEGFARAAVRLAAAAVRASPSDAIRAEGQRIMEASGAGTTKRSRPTPASVKPQAPEVSESVKRAVAAIRAGDVDAVERAVEAAVANGRDPAAVDRVRAIAHLARGDVASAKRTLDRAADVENRPGTRALLAQALVQQHTDPSGAVRSALAALAAAQRAADAPGVTAARRVIAQCLRALGLEEGAASVELRAAP